MGKVVTHFLAIPVCAIATGRGLFDALEAELSSCLIPWENVVGFSSDSATVMVGIRNSVLSHMRAKQPDIFSLACVCHLAALFTTSGLKTLPFSVDGLLIDTANTAQSVCKRLQMYGVTLTSSSTAPQGG